jgi:hypothetical protein
MAAINRVQYHPPLPISFCEGPRIIKKLIDVVIQILELPLYIPPFLDEREVNLLETWDIKPFA